MREPAFWQRRASLAARLLTPFGGVYGAVAALRLAQHGRRAALPVVCIGNPTVGGAGKTPTALTVGGMLEAAGEHPAFLTRGYGGAERGPMLVDLRRHRAPEVGDEPLLLARRRPTIVARARVEGAALAAAIGATAIVMDDGFQNPSLAKDIAVLVCDARVGIGNGRVIPAGPLRAPFNAQLARAHALVVIRTTAEEASDGAAEIEARARRQGIAVFAARLIPDAGVVAALAAARVLAFAGIGDPRKFYISLLAAGIRLAATRDFPDHHRYSSKDAQVLCAQADREGLVLVTTEKDMVRMAGDEATVELTRRARALPVALAFDEEERFRSFLLERLAAVRAGNAVSSRRRHAR